MRKSAISNSKKGFKALLSASLLTFILVWSNPHQAFAGDFELGIKAYHAHNYSLAIRFFRTASKTDRNNANIHYYLADALVQLKRYREAQIEYQKILALAPSSQAARFSRVSLGKLRQLEGNRYQVKGKARTQQKNLTAKHLTGERIDKDKIDKFKGLFFEGEDYLEDVTDSGRRIRWSALKMPLKFHVQRSPVGVRNFQPNFINSMRKALDIWVRALDGKLTYVMVGAPEEADIKVTWVNTLDTEGQASEAGTIFHAGITIPQIRQDRLYNMEIKMATFDIIKKPQSGDNIFAIAIHEMGHALGLLGHSENPEDIMYAQNKLVYELSPRDKTTIQKLYGEIADITSLPPSSEKDPVREAELAKRLDEQILKEEAKTEAKGDSLTWLNLGTTYFAKGKAVNREAKKSEDPIEVESLKEEAQEWFDKAIETINHSILLEPRSSLAYYNRSIIFQEFEAIEPALHDIDLAIKFDENNAQYYRERAWILGKLNRKVEALNALDAYLLREPYNANSDEVTRIRKLLKQI